MTVCMYLSSDPITLAGQRSAFMVSVRDAISGHELGEFLFVLPGDGTRQYISAADRTFDEIDAVLNHICQRPDRVAA